MLRGYKEIVLWLERQVGVPLSVEEACRYSKWQLDPLPVKRPWIGKQSTGRIYAWSHEVEAWAKRHFKKAPTY